MQNRQSTNETESSTQHSPVNNIAKIRDQARSQIEKPWVIDVDQSETKIQAQNGSAWADIEPRRDGSIIVTGWREYSWDDEEEVPFNRLYAEVHSVDAAVETVVEFCDDISRVDDDLLEGLDTLSANRLAEVISDTDAVFAALVEDLLARGMFGFVYHVPAGHRGTDVRDELEEYDAVVVDGQPYNLAYGHVLQADVHYHRRVPLYAEAGLYGLEDVTPADGAQNVRDFAEGDTEATPLPSETVDVEIVIRELVSAGAVAIGVQPELSNRDTLTFKTWAKPVKAREIVGSYGQVTVGDEAFDVNWEFECTFGPQLTSRVSIYATDTIRGMAPVEVEEGLQNLQEYVEAGCPSTTMDLKEGGRP